MLNETLSILAVRYAQVVPSQARSQLVLVDISNLLLCMADILPSVCESGEEYAGLNVTKLSKSIRDIHCKCQELFIILLMRGIPLGSLYKILRKGPSSIAIFRQRDGSSSPWIQFTLPTIFASDEKNQWADKSSEFGQKAAIAFELKILLNSPQANWSLLLKILLMRNAQLSSIIFNHLVQHLPTSDRFKPALSQPFSQQETKAGKCDRFLCGKECNSVAEWICDDDGMLRMQFPPTFYLLLHYLRRSNRTDELSSGVGPGVCCYIGWSSCRYSIGFSDGARSISRQRMVELPGSQTGVEPETTAMVRGDSSPHLSCARSNRTRNAIVNANWIHDLPGKALSIRWDTNVICFPFRADNGRNVILPHRNVGMHSK